MDTDPRVRPVQITRLAAVVLAIAQLPCFSPGTCAAAEPEKPQPTAPETKTGTPPAATPVKATATPPRKDKRRPGEVATTGTMRISVVDSAGQPIPGATIHVCQGTASTCDGPPTKDYPSDANGHADVEIPKTVNYLAMWAGSKGFGSLGAEWRPFMNGELLPEAFSFRLPRGTTIGGVVKDDEGRPIQGVRVKVADTNVFIGHGDAAPITDAEGRWTLDDVAPGDNWISFSLSHPDYVSDMRWAETQRDQHVTSAALRAQTATAVMHRGTTITGTLTDPDGKPVPGAVVVWGDEPLRSRRLQQEVRTDEKGQYRFPPLPKGAMPVAVMAQGWMPDLRTIDVAAETPPVDFQLKPGKKLRLRFVDPLGSPIRDVTVSIDTWRKNRSLYNDKHPDLLDTAIPTLAKEGVFEWTWAPDDPVTYVFSATDSAAHRFVAEHVTLTADDQEHVQVLRPRVRVAGSVVDARTGLPIPRFTVIPARSVILQRDAAQDFSDGQYAIDLLPFPAYVRHLWIEADGYRRAMSVDFRDGQPIPNCDFHLEPTTSEPGRIVDEDGAPVAGAKVYVATKMQGFHITHYPGELAADPAISDASGVFVAPAQFERYTLIAMHDRGYAEVTREPDQAPGELRLEKWARVEGRLFRAGKPVAKAPVTLEALRPRMEHDPHIFDRFPHDTDDSGRFVFDRVPPGQYALIGMRDDMVPAGSNESLPLDLKPGDDVVRDLNNDGAILRGRVARKGDTAEDVALIHLKNWLAPTARDNDSLEQDEWPKLRVERRKYRHHYFVKLERDGTFLISGVPAGEYDLVLNVPSRATPRGVVNSRPPRIVRIQVADSDVATGTLDVGLIEIDP